ncbi:MAG: metalloprotease family protein [Clostridiaceae bacterium]|nr:metalloprotease family protein [Clostridiaceae bacterium]
MFLYNNFPNYIDEFAQNFPTMPIDKNTPEKQRNYCYTIMLIMSLPISFGLGNYLYYHNYSLKSILSFIGYFILSCIIIIPLHYLILALSISFNFKDRIWCFGFNKRYLVPFSYCKKIVSRNRIIVSIIIQFIIFTVIPYYLMMFFFANLILYAIASCNALISSFQIYDMYILLRYVKGNKMILKSNNKYYIIDKK